ncbi:hypothetical protein J6590_021340 [Homalodisca vitripennis]|nr:hypothetical protein J6590_021340 [Homalodisca vitripennis]
MFHYEIDRTAQCIGAILSLQLFTYPAVGAGSEVTIKPLVLRLSVREGFLALTSPGHVTVNKTLHLITLFHSSVLKLHCRSEGDCGSSSNEMPTVCKELMFPTNKEDTG